MIRHLFRMVWNRKKSNALILLEIFLSFLVLFAICSAGFYFRGNFGKPLGFSHQDVWVLSLEPPRGLMQGDARQEGVNLYEQLLKHIRGEQEVIHAAGVSVEAYGQSSWGTVLEHEGRNLYLHYTPADLEFDKAMDLEMLEGRFWNEADLVPDVKPILVNEALARDLFGNDSALNRIVTFNEKDRKIIGVFRDYRHKGDLSQPVEFAMVPHLLSESWTNIQPKLVMKMQPGVSMAFEEGLIKDLEAMAPGWSFQVKTMERMRKDYFKLWISTMAVAALIAGFMLIMVAMGLVGVLWQSVTRRTSELGVRRAKGATKKMIHLQILGELMVLTTLAVFMALLVALQLPVLGMFNSVGNGILVSGFGLAMVIIYLLTAFSGLYPSWLATTVNPAQALHYE